MPKEKSKKQVGYLLSKGSPLSSGQKGKLKKELHSGAVKVKGGKGKHGKGPKHRPRPSQRSMHMT